MNLGDVFKELKVDTWYKVILVLGIALLFISFTVEVKVLTNQQLALLSGGMIFIGLGIWQSTGKRITFNYLFQIETPVFMFNIAGWLLLILGLAFLIIFGADLLGINLLAALGITIPTIPTPQATAITSP